MSGLDGTIHSYGGQAASEPTALAPDRSRLLSEINAAIISHADIPDLLAAVSACLRREIKHDFAAVCLYDPATDQLKMHALDFASNPDFIKHAAPIPMDGTINGLVFRTRSVVLRHRIDLAEFPSDATEQVVAQGLKSACIAPLASHGRTLGTLAVASKNESAFTNQDAETLTQIANQVALAAETALSYAEVRMAQSALRKSRDRSRLLLKVNNSLVSRLELPELMKALASSLHEVIHQDFAGIALYDSAT